MRHIMGFFENVSPPVPASWPGPVRAPWLAPPDHQVGAVVPAPPVLGATGDTAVSIGGVVAYPSGVEITLEVRLRPGTAAGVDPRLSVAWAQEAHRMVRFGVVLPDGSRAVAAEPAVPLSARLGAHDAVSPAGLGVLPGGLGVLPDRLDASGSSSSASSISFASSGRPPGEPADVPGEPADISDLPLLTVVDSSAPGGSWADVSSAVPPPPVPGYGPGVAYGTFTAGFVGGGRAPTVHRLRYWLWPLPPAGPLTLVVDFPARGLAESSVTVDGSALRAAAERAVTLWPAGDGLDEPGQPPADVPAEAARVRAAFTQAFTGGRGGDGALAAVEGGEGVRELLERVRARFSTQVASARVLVGEPVFTDPAHAQVPFEVVVRGGALGGVAVGAAVLVAGDWKVATRTYTGVLARSGIGMPVG